MDRSLQQPQAPPDAPGVPGDWTVREALQVLIAVLLAGPLVLGLISIGVLPGLDDAGSAPFWSAVSVVYYGLPLAAIVVIGRSKPGGLLRASGLRATSPAWAFGGAFVGMLVATAFNTAYTAAMAIADVGPPETSMRVMEQLIESVRGGPLATAISVVLVTVLAPFVEEIVFRGVLLSGLVKRYGAAVGIGLTSIAFGAAHADPWRMLPLMFLGVVLGFLAWQGRSIWPAFVAHGLVNGFAYLVALASVPK